LEQNRVAMVLKKSPLPGREPTNIYDTTGWYAHPLQRWQMGDR